MDEFKARFSRVQTLLKAPKNLRNSFGNYNYRNAESILEAVKPFLTSENLLLTLNDDVQSFGERLFVKATATITDIKSNETISTSALAEIDAHKGMSADQCVGCASSYARKYALNGLFLLDDTKDEDSDEFHKEQTAKAQKPKEEVTTDPNAKISKVQAGALLNRIGTDQALLELILASYKLTTINDMIIKDFEVINRNWDKFVGKAHESKNQ